MKTFKQYYNFKEAYSYEYIVPKDFSKQMADFYILTTIYQTIELSNISNTEMDLQLIIDNAINKIVEIQHQTLLEMFVSLSIQYMLYDSDDQEEIIDNIPENIKSKLLNAKFHDDKFKYKENYLKFKKSNLSFDNLIKIIENSYKLTHSDALKSMLNAVKNLAYANNIKSKIKAIDFSYSLVHNFTIMIHNMPVKNTSLLSSILDTKFEGDLWDIQQYASIPQSFIGKVQKYLPDGSSLENKKDNFYKHSPHDSSDLIKRIWGGDIP
jgi:hypothetical protein